MTQDKKEIPQTPELILEQMFVNLNNLKEALNIQANKNTKIEPVISNNSNTTPKPIPTPISPNPLPEPREDGIKK